MLKESGPQNVSLNCASKLRKRKNTILTIKCFLGTFEELLTNMVQFGCGGGAV